MNELIEKSFGRYHILEQLGEGGMGEVLSSFPLKVFLCHAHIIPLWDADRDPVRTLRAASHLTKAKLI